MVSVVRCNTGDVKCTARPTIGLDAGLGIVECATYTGILPERMDLCIRMRCDIGTPGLGEFTGGSALRTGAKMQKVTTQAPPRTDGVPEDLAVFQRRMWDCGIHVRLPDAGSNFRMPDPIHIEGESLSDTVIRLRGG